MNVPASLAAPAAPLVEVIELKWLLAGEGVYLHVERMLADDVYAGRALARAAASASPVLRAAAERLRARLAHA
jgi:hypothetical protein